MNIQQSINQAITATAFLRSQTYAFKEQQQRKQLTRQQNYASKLGSYLDNRAYELEKQLFTEGQNWDDDMRQGTSQQIDTLRAKASEAWDQSMKYREQRAYLGQIDQYAQELEDIGFGSSDERLQKAQAQAQMAAKSKARAKGGK